MVFFSLPVLVAPFVLAFIVFVVFYICLLLKRSRDTEKPEASETLDPSISTEDTQQKEVHVINEKAVAFHFFGCLIGGIGFAIIAGLIFIVGFVVIVKLFPNHF